MKPIKTLSPEGRLRYIGYIEGNRFISKRNWELHYFRNYNGFGFNLRLIKGLIEQGIKEIFLFVEKDGETIFYKTTPSEVFTNGIEYHNSKDIGDIQLILPINYFTGEENENKKNQKQN